MKNATPVRRLLGRTIAGLLLLAACTPEQLETYSEYTGKEFTVEEHDALVALPDLPLALPAPDYRLVLADGTVTDDLVAIVNGLPYSYQSREPVMQAFRIVAAARGWTPQQIASWETAVWDIALKEAQGCWNVRYGAKFAYWDGRGCILKSGRGAKLSGRGAAGYGQITSVLWHITCNRVGLCDGASIVASPWNSMLALVAVIEDQGVGPWCYNSWARRYHRNACYNAGLDVP